ncbi:hypothetical protein [Nitrosomonas oligotropha]|nr:hypothetical protein [Nitrosomonas oligotropha]
MKASQGVRMDNFGNYLTIKQAKNFLSERINSKVSKLNLLEMAARGDIRLCAWFDGIVAEFKRHYPDPIRAGVFQVKLKCYVRIPEHAISPISNTFSFESIEPVEVIHPYETYRAPKEYQLPNNQPLPGVEPDHFWAAYSGNAGTGEKIKCVKYEINSTEAVTPKEDLLNLIEKNKNTGQSEPQVTKSENIKPWLEPDPKDPKPAQDWYTPARYFARQLVREDSTLLIKRKLLAQKVAQSLSNVNIYKRGKKLPLSYTTILKSFSNVSLG